MQAGESRPLSGGDGAAVAAAHDFLGLSAAAAAVQFFKRKG